MRITLLRLRALRLSFFLVSCLCSAQVFAQSVNTRVTADSLTIGEIFEYSIAIQFDREYQNTQYPDTNSFPPSLELLERQQFRTSDFSDSLVYTLQYFNNEDVQISSLPITLYGLNDSSTVFTDPVPLYFKTVVAPGDTTFKPMKPIYAFSRPWWPWILGVLAVAGFLLWWFKLRDHDVEESVDTEPQIEPFYNPLEELEKQLLAIRKESKVAETKNFKLFYSEVGDAIRAYFEDLYNIPALECTSSELLRYLDAYGVDDTLTEKTRLVLRKADLVKFAKYTPTLEDAWQTYDYALEFLERAKLADSARIGRLKAKYDQQFMITSPQKDEGED
ncbi:hypothetical protein [Gracilimonas sp.]|uniref:hypothetical protein n=1 Tax=Gracilimonas sp. TaxID=1974203 RepID=UPI003BACE6B6